MSEQSRPEPPGRPGSSSGQCLVSQFLVRLLVAGWARERGYGPTEAIPDWRGMETSLGRFTQTSKAAWQERARQFFCKSKQKRDKKLESMQRKRQANFDSMLGLDQAPTGRSRGGCFVV